MHRADAKATQEFRFLFHSRHFVQVTSTDLINPAAVSD
jgi:hypothetical protein